MTALAQTQPPAADAHQERARLRDTVLGRALLTLPAGDVDVTFRTLARLEARLTDEVDLASLAIPTDGHGNPLPDDDSQAYRLWWSALNDQLEDLVVLGVRMLAGVARAKDEQS